MKRRANILYRLRRKGIQCLTKQHTILFPYGKQPYSVLQIRQLVREFNFTVQFQL